ncbi:glutamate--ammonia ligase [Microbotryomycetes sp. JL221]|nr:glutamate--ammonia ligase [Microbotryomycetes sp. JL221]
MLGTTKVGTSTGVECIRQVLRQQNVTLNVLPWLRRAQLATSADRGRGRGRGRSLNNKAVTTLYTCETISRYPSHTLIGSNKLVNNMSRLLNPSQTHLNQRGLIQLQPHRSFHSTRSNKDVFWVSIPAVKQILLTMIRTTLVILPLAWRWGWFKKFPNQAKRLWTIPLVGLCLVVGLGLNQSPKTARWRLLLMSPREELEWSNKRFEEIIVQEEHLLLPPTDERTVMVKRVCDRLIQTLNDDQPLSCVSVLTDGQNQTVNDQGVQRQRRPITPSAQTDVMTMPFLPESSNPEKIIPRSTWNIFCVDLPKINAFVLPSTDIFIYTGLLSVTEDDENLLAAVLAHEISHCVERHVVESLGFMALSGVLFDILRGTSFVLTLSFPFLGDALASGFNFLDRQVSQRAYSRKLETEADVLGLELMARAGFDPRGAITLWEILNEVESDISTTGEHGTITDHIDFLRTHPTGQQRLEDLNKSMPKALKLYESSLKQLNQIKEFKAMKQMVKEQEELNFERIKKEDDERIKDIKLLNQTQQIKQIDVHQSSLKVIKKSDATVSQVDQERI